MTDREQIEALYRDYWRCMIAADTTGLRAMMTADYTLQHMTDATQTAEDFLRGVRDGTFRYFSAEHDSTDVHIDGDRAVLIGKSRVRAAVYGGREHPWRLRGDFTLRKEQGRWKFTSSRASTY